MPSVFDFSDKVAIVTGGASGIGLATAELLLASHAKVFAVDVSPLAEQSLIDAGNKSASAFAFHQVDLTDPGAAEAIVAKCQERFGPKIDVLANVAGIIDDFTAADQVSDKILDRVLEINLKAPIRLMRQVLPVMVKGGGGAIVNVSSKAGQSGACAGIAYTSSKHGLVSSLENFADVPCGSPVLIPCGRLARPRRLRGSSVIGT
jgi:NAD(P)-dependent dehydrogenase (short-subunit alcohol dehydrogenase family)